MACDCIEIVDAELAKHNTRLTQPIVFGSDQTVRLMVRTEEIAKVRGKGAVSMFASFCPFCGVSYVEDEQRRRAYNMANLIGGAA